MVEEQADLGDAQDLNVQDLNVKATRRDGSLDLAIRHRKSAVLFDKREIQVHIGYQDSSTYQQTEADAKSKIR